MESRGFIKGLFSYIMMLSLLFQLASNTSMILWHKIANDSFEKNFCVNKNIPEKSCHGACMMKKINKAPSEKEDLGNHIPFINLELSNFICPGSAMLPLLSPIESKVKADWYCLRIKQDFILKVFHPPENLV